jgi:hypothetical protein
VSRVEAAGSGANRPQPPPEGVAGEADRGDAEDRLERREVGKRAGGADQASGLCSGNPDIAPFESEGSARQWEAAWPGGCAS